MPDTGQPHIKITRHEAGQVDAEGDIDAFAYRVLERAGFEAYPILRGTWIRLLFDIPEQSQNRAASYAAAMLRAAGYTVTISPSLETPAADAGNRPQDPAAPTAETAGPAVGTPQTSAATVAPVPPAPGRQTPPRR
ncbi:hypothetical protein OK074_5010 [Actinobacteria bacterium OK074]|nr:hypothetical protein OK074_5010 [Actinobacteria bacterium OK074]